MRERERERESACMHVVDSWVRLCSLLLSSWHTTFLCFLSHAFVHVGSCCHGSDPSDLAAAGSADSSSGQPDHTVMWHLRQSPTTDHMGQEGRRTPSVCSVTSCFVKNNVLKICYFKGTLLPRFESKKLCTVVGTGEKNIISNKNICNWKYDWFYGLSVLLMISFLRSFARFSLPSQVEHQFCV